MPENYTLKVTRNIWRVDAPGMAKSAYGGVNVQVRLTDAVKAQMGGETTAFFLGTYDYQTKKAVLMKRVPRPPDWPAE